MSQKKLSNKQQSSVYFLARALESCVRNNVYLWDDYGLISAVNGNWILDIRADDLLDEILDDSIVDVLPSSCWHGSNADDNLFVKLKHRRRSS